MQTNRIWGALAAIGATAAAVQGCSQEKTHVPLSPETSSEHKDADRRKHEAIDALAGAQCDRAQRCHKVGPNTEYASRDHCMTRMRAEAQKSVGKCDKGIDRHDLEQCVGEVQNQDCGGFSLEGLQTSIACDTDDLCLG
jgi:hypothetical protein